MANEKNKINELVSDDDDSTAELEAITFQADEPYGPGNELESDADTFGFEQPGGKSAEQDATLSSLRSDLEKRAQTIGRLQYDIEQLRSRWIGLETEIKAREEIVSSLRSDVEDLNSTNSRKDTLLKKRDAKIKSLKSEIRQREEKYRTLSGEFDEARHRIDELHSANAESSAALLAAKQEIADLHDNVERDASSELREFPELAGDAYTNNEIRAQLLRSEQYADSLRRKLQDHIEARTVLAKDKEYLLTLVEQESQHIGDQIRGLDSANEAIVQLQSELLDQQQAHEKEIRIVRFELGQAQDTLAETSELNEQLTSDLVDTRGFKQELERMLSVSEERAEHRIEELQEAVKVLSHTAEEYQQKLDSKSAAINVLLSELSKKSEQIESIGEIESVIHDIDYRMSERFDDGAAPHTSSEREKITRVLVGNIGDQVLRFPLFKKRLTIGRTAENDIQLNPSYISRRHAVILTEGDSTRVIDWGSKNGVYVNAQRVKEHFLSNGDIVAVGNAKFRYEERRKRDS